MSDYDDFVPWTCRNRWCDKHDATDIRARPNYPIRCTCGTVRPLSAGRDQ